MPRCRNPSGSTGHTAAHGTDKRRAVSSGTTPTQERQMSGTCVRRGPAPRASGRGARTWSAAGVELASPSVGKGEPNIARNKRSGPSAIRLHHGRRVYDRTEGATANARCARAGSAMSVRAQRLEISAARDRLQQAARVSRLAGNLVGRHVMHMFCGVVVWGCRGSDSPLRGTQWRCAAVLACATARAGQRARCLTRPFSTGNVGGGG